MFRPSSATARRKNAVYYAPVWEGVYKTNCRGFHAVECQLLSSVLNHTFSCSLWHKSRVKKIALISFLTPAEWALRSCGCLKWSVAVKQGSLLLLNERGCFWWLTWLVGSLLFWNDRKGALKVLRASLPPALWKSIKTFVSIFAQRGFFQRNQMWLFLGYNLKTMWKCFSGMHKQQSGS